MSKKPEAKVKWIKGMDLDDGRIPTPKPTKKEGFYSKFIYDEHNNFIREEMVAQND